MGCWIRDHFHQFYLLVLFCVLTWRKSLFQACFAILLRYEYGKDGWKGIWKARGAAISGWVIHERKIRWRSARKLQGLWMSSLVQYNQSLYVSALPSFTPRVYLQFWTTRMHLLRSSAATWSKLRFRYRFLSPDGLALLLWTFLEIRFGGQL